MKTKAFTREERQAMIVTWFAIRVQNGNLSFATMHEIARGLGMSPSTHLQKLISGMCFQNRLMWRKRVKSGRWDGREYMLFPGTYTEPKKRSIPVNVRGKSEAQLELF